MTIPDLTTDQWTGLMDARIAALYGRITATDDADQQITCADSAMANWGK